MLPTTTSFSSQDKSMSRSCHPQTHKEDKGLFPQIFPSSPHRYAYLLRSSVPLLDHCVPLPAGLTAGRGPSFILTHSSIRAYPCSVCTPSLLKGCRSSGQLLSVGHHPRAGRPTLQCCTDSGSDLPCFLPCFHPDTEPGSMSSSFKEALFISW